MTAVPSSSNSKQFELKSCGALTGSRQPGKYTHFFFFQSFLASYLVRPSGPSPTASVRCPLNFFFLFIMVHHYPKIQSMSKILILNVCVCVCVTCLRVTVSAVTLEGGTLGIYLFDEYYKKDYICISPTTLNIFKDTVYFIHKYDYIYQVYFKIYAINIWHKHNEC